MMRGSTFDASQAEEGLSTFSRPLLMPRRLSTKKFSTFGDDNSSNEAVTARLHFSVWPKKNPEELAVLLEKHPDQLDKTFGPHDDTLLHR